MKPDINEVPAFFRGYVNAVEGDDIIQILKLQLTEIPSFLRFIPDEKAAYRYAVDKWSIKDIVQHMIDTERIMCYRALRFARNDKNQLPGFEQDDYVKFANAETRTMDNLIKELTAVRESTICMFQTFDAAAFERKGIASGVELSVNLLAYIIAGHINHHIHILKTKYF